MNVPFHKPYIGELEEQYIQKALHGIMSGDGEFTSKARELFFAKTGVKNLLLTTSGTHALEAAAILCQIKRGDEVILPSYTFSSTANAFLLRGAKLIFCEIDPSTMNMDTKRMEALITPKTKAVVPVHYAGVPCDMDAINKAAKRNNLFVVEDAAQAVGSKYKSIPAGSLSDVGCYSFHSTKNYCMGEGGGLAFKSDELFEKAEIIREKGTDRGLFLRGQVDKYTWRDAGSSYLPSDLLAAVLCAQLEKFDEIMQSRIGIWQDYYKAFKPLEQKEKVKLQYIPDYSSHNAHMFFIILPTAEKRNSLMRKLNQDEIKATSHYEPLHASPMGAKLGYRPQDLYLTTDYAARLLRLPLFAGMSREMKEYVMEKVVEYVN